MPDDFTAEMDQRPIRISGQRLKHLVPLLNFILFTANQPHGLSRVATGVRFTERDKVHEGRVGNFLARMAGVPVIATYCDYTIIGNNPPPSAKPLEALIRYGKGRLCKRDEHSFWPTFQWDNIDVSTLAPKVMSAEARDEALAMFARIHTDLSTIENILTDKIPRENAAVNPEYYLRETRELKEDYALLRETTEGARPDLVRHERLLTAQLLRGTLSTLPHQCKPVLDTDDYNALNAAVSRIEEDISRHHSELASAIHQALYLYTTQRLAVPNRSRAG